MNMTKVICKFCNKRIYKHQRAKQYNCYRCLQCNVAYWFDILNKKLENVTLHSSDGYYVQLDYLNTKTSIWYIKSKSTFSISKFIRAFNCSHLVTQMDGLLYVSPITLKHKIKIILTFL